MPLLSGAASSLLTAYMLRAGEAKLGKHFETLTRDVADINEQLALLTGVKMGDRLHADVAGIDEKPVPLTAGRPLPHQGLAGLPLVLRSAAASIREVAGGKALPQMFTWTHVEVSDLLRRVGLSQYEKALAPLGGAALLGLDDAGLAEYLNYGASAPAAPRARAAAAPRIKHCTTCGAEMLSRQKLCRVCRTPVAPEDAGGVGLLRGVRIKKVQDGVKYQSFLWHHGKSNYLGTFYTQEEAAKTYDDAYRAACEEDGNEPSAAVLNWPTVEAAAAAVEEARQAANVADRKEISKRKLAKHGAAQGAGADGAAPQKTLALTAPPATTAAAAPKAKKRPAREVDMFTSDAPPLMQQWTAGHVQPAPQLAAPDAAAAATGSVFDMLGL